MQARDQIQRIVARTIANSQAGHDLYLIGGFRYRLLDRSARVSEDLDYHWPGDLASKRDELLLLAQRRIIPEVRRELAFDGDARVGHPADESDWLRSVQLAFWRAGVPLSRVELPIELTRVHCHDKPAARIADGTVYLTASDADMVENKVIALFGRKVVEHRDFVDLFLFAGNLVADSPQRVRRKLELAGLSLSAILLRLKELASARQYHAKAIEQVLLTQLDGPAAGAILQAGGGAMIFDQVMQLLSQRLQLGAVP